MTWWELARTRIREARRLKGWSQKRLAEEITERGYPLSERAIGKLETGDIRVDIVLLEVIANATDQPLDFFMPDRDTHSVARLQVDALLDQLSLDDLAELRALAQAKLERQRGNKSGESLPKAERQRSPAKTSART